MLIWLSPIFFFRRFGVSSWYHCRRAVPYYTGRLFLSSCKAKKGAKQSTWCWNTNVDNHDFGIGDHTARSGSAFSLSTGWRHLPTPSSGLCSRPNKPTSTTSSVSISISVAPPPLPWRGIADHTARSGSAFSLSTGWRPLPTPPVGYAQVPTNPPVPPPAYPYPLESPPPYPGEECVPQYTPPSQS